MISASEIVGSLHGLGPFAPVLALLGAAIAVPGSAVRTGWPRAAVAAAAAAVILHYLLWRIGSTEPGEDAGVFGRFFFHLVLVVEMLGWTHAGVLLFTLSRRSDRTPETDARAARTLATDPDELPAVDVLIPSYDEPLEVLERTIVAARAIRWPSNKIRVWILDDGRRIWLQNFARAMGAEYMTRPDNAHAKAGNLNNAFGKTSAPFILVLDADFVAQPQILERMMGWFDDPKVGVVQAPQHFFNFDPLQSVPALRGAMPGDQRFFFGEIMVGRDAVDCAFCCGSNGIIRREALEAIGGEMPTGSITEDVLLTLAMLRKGYVTRYVNEKLAVGLAPESLAAFFVQRARWARGSIQTLYLKDGPLGPGLTLLQRVMFLPTHWVSGVVVTMAGVLAPLVSTLSGQGMLGAISLSEAVTAALPAIVATFGSLRLLAPTSYHPLAAMTLSVLQSFRIGPTILWTLFRPHGARFVVTPKGKDARSAGDVVASRIMLTIAAATVAAVGLSALSGGAGAGGAETIAGAAAAAFVSGLLVLSAAAAAAAPPAFRKEERELCDEPTSLLLRPEGPAVPARLLDLSVAGFCVKRLDGGAALEPGAVAAVDVTDVGRLVGRVAWGRGSLAGCVTVEDVQSPDVRAALIRRIYCRGFALDEGDGSGAIAMTRRMIGAIFREPPKAPPPPAVEPASEGQLRRARALLDASAPPALTAYGGVALAALRPTHERDEARSAAERLLDEDRAASSVMVSEGDEERAANAA